MEGIRRRLFEELDKLKVDVNEEKTKFIDLNQGESFTFLGFDSRRTKSLNGKWRANYQPKMQARLNLIEKVRDVFRRFESQPLTRVRDII